MRLILKFFLNMYIKMMDIKIIGITSIVILLILGYFVYILYQDLVFLKKELEEFKSLNVQEWDYEETDDEKVLSDEEQDLELENHLNSFLESQKSLEGVKSFLPPIEEVDEEQEEVLVVPESLPNIKKRKQKSK